MGLRRIDQDSRRIRRPKRLYRRDRDLCLTEGAVNGFKKGAGMVTLVALPVCAVIAKLYASYQLKKEDANKAKQALSSYMESNETIETAQEEQND